MPSRDEMADLRANGIGLADSAGTKPQRMSLTNLTSGRGLVAQFNPAEFSEKIQVNWARKDVVGMSYKPLQYQGTNNTGFDLDLYFNVKDGDEQIRIYDARRFLQSVCFPPQGAQTVIGGAPPRLLFVWPGFISLTCVITDLEMRYTRFFTDGNIAQMTATVKLEEMRDIRLTMEDVYANSTLRSGAAAEKEELE